MLGIDWPRAQPEANLFLTLSAYAQYTPKAGYNQYVPRRRIHLRGLVSMEGFNKEQQEGLITLQQSSFVLVNLILRGSSSRHVSTFVRLFDTYTEARCLASFLVHSVNHKYFEARWFGNFPLSFIRSVDILRRVVSASFFNGSFSKDSESRWFGHR